MHGLPRMTEEEPRGLEVGGHGLLDFDDVLRKGRKPIANRHGLAVATEGGTSLSRCGDRRTRGCRALETTAAGSAGGRRSAAREGGGGAVWARGVAGSARAPPEPRRPRPLPTRPRGAPSPRRSHLHSEEAVVPSPGGPSCRSSGCCPPRPPPRV